MRLRGEKIMSKGNVKNPLMAGLVYFIVFVMYNLFLFLFFEEFNKIFWISYGFMAATYLFHIVCIFLIIKNLSVETAFFGIPLASFTLYFVIAEFFCSLVFMIFKDVASVKVTVIIQTLLLCVFVIIAIISIVSRDAVQNVDTKIKQNVATIKGLNIDVEMLMQRCTVPDVTMELKKLSETIKYSDPMTHEVVAMQEQMVMQNMMELRTAFDSGDMEKVKSLCNTINLLMIERNKKLMLAK